MFSKKHSLYFTQINFITRLLKCIFEKHRKIKTISKTDAVTSKTLLNSDDKLDRLIKEKLVPEIELYSSLTVNKIYINAVTDHPGITIQRHLQMDNTKEADDV